MRDLITSDVPGLGSNRVSVEFTYDLRKADPKVRGVVYAHKPVMTTRVIKRLQCFR